MTAEAEPRIPDCDPDRLSNETAGLLELAASATGHTPGTISVLAHQPALLGPFLGWAAALALNGALPKRDHELLALRAAANCRSAFEWDEHVGFARAVGLTDDEIAMVKAGPDDPRWTPDEAALLRAADELGRECAISAGTWAVLAARYDEAALVEIPFVVGQYTMLSMVANGLNVPS